MKRIFALFLSALCLVNGLLISSSSVYAEETITDSAVYPEISLYSSYAPVGGDIYYLESLDIGNTKGTGVIDPTNYNEFQCIYKYSSPYYTYTYLNIGFAYQTTETTSDSSLYIYFNPSLYIGGKKFYMSDSYLTYLYYVTVSGKAFYCSPKEISGEGFYVNNPYFLTKEQGTFYFVTCKYTFQYDYQLPFDDYSLGQAPAKLYLTSVCYDDESAESLGYPKPAKVWTETSSFVPPSLPPDTTEPTSSPGPTSDPALGTISDDLNNLDKNEQTRHEETKGFLGNIIDNIISLPKKIADLFIDGLKTLFIPSDGYLTSKMDEVTKTLEEHLGFLAFPMKLLNDILQMVNSFGGSGSGKIELPACQINLNGETHTLWDKQTFDFNDVLKNFPILNEHLYTATNFVCFACVLMFAANIIKKYLPIDGANMVEELIDDDK